MARISAFCLCLGVAAALLAAGSASAQLVGGRSLQSTTATPTSATAPAAATRPTNPYAVNGVTQPDPFSIATPQGVAGATSSSLGAISTMPATAAQAQAAGSQQPASYGAEGQPTAPPAYSIQSAPVGGPYAGPQPAPYPYNQLPQYQPQAGQPQQAPGTPQALAPAYNQIPSPYGAMLAQPVPASTAQGGALPPQPQIIEGGYTLGPGDRVRITVFGEQDLSGEYQLDGNGNIRLPLVGVIRAAGLTQQALEIALYSALVPNYLRNPRLTAEITHYRPVYVVGAVIKPGQYDYVHDMTLLQAIALAGGFNNQAKESEVYVRREGETGEQLVPTSQPLLVRPGDTVRVDTTLFWDALNVFAPISGPAYLLK